MKKLMISQMGITLLVVMLAMGFIACSQPGGGTTGSSDDATLSSVKVNAVTATLGTPAASYAAITSPGTVRVFDKAITVDIATTNSSADAKVQKVSGSDTPDPEAYWYDVDFTVDISGDFLAIEVTAADETTKLYYKIAVLVVDIALEELTIDGKEMDLDYLIPAETWQTASAYPFLFSIYQDEQEGGVKIEATPALAGSTVKYAFATEGDTPVFENEDTLILENGGYIYIEVTSVASGEKGYYKVVVYFKQDAIIKYGSPTVLIEANGTVDQVWNDPSLQELQIRRLFPGDGIPAGYDVANPTTHGVAKVLWDESGLWVYVKVTDPDVSSAGKAGSQAHETDSVELFVNEDMSFVPPGEDDTTKGRQMYSNGGSQYRVGANGESSGEGPNEPGTWAVKKAAWKGDGGYTIVFQAPWRLRGKFYDSYEALTATVKDIGFELQINAAPVTGNRYATLTWNNTANTNYQNAGNYGTAKLQTKTPLSWPTLVPNIVSAPMGGIYEPGDSVTLTVDAHSPDNSGLTYQWYSAASASATGTAIGGQTAKTYTFTAPALSGADIRADYFYYVIVTNTRGPLGTQTATTPVANVIVTSVPMVERLTLRQSVAIYEFRMPLGEQFSNYKAITVDYQVDAANRAKGIRFLRLLGNYERSDFTVTGSKLNAAFDTYNGPYIFDNLGPAVLSAETTGLYATTPVTDWFTVTYRLVASNAADASSYTDFISVPDVGFVAAHRPINENPGPFYFGVGIPGENGAQITTLVKNVTLVHKTDPAKNVITKTSGMGDAFAGYTGSDGLNVNTREWIADPSAPVTDRVFDFTASPKKNATAIVGRWKPVIEVDLGADFDVSKYESVVVDIKFYDTANAELPASGNIGWSYATLKWWNASKAAIATDTGNVGQGQTSPITIPLPTFSGSLRYLNFDSADASGNETDGTGMDNGTAIDNYIDLRYIEISKITFLVAVAP